MRRGAGVGREQRANGLERKARLKSWSSGPVWPMSGPQLLSLIVQSGALLTYLGPAYGRRAPTIVRLALKENALVEKWLVNMFLLKSLTALPHRTSVYDQKKKRKTISVTSSEASRDQWNVEMVCRGVPAPEVPRRGR
ncbi:hypothetical protein RRG08_025582 [Elysia crispata]|uniref:Uncharacterized protein n=1 Tax=Elysia crispata TaxID=231223 RepID=A0AAE0YDZ1_9GAST|nr:hypothetical protein RRG08_025582 [Elysia crispata]